MNRPIRVAVLMGGPSSEHDVSLATGRKIMDALDPERYIAHPVMVSREREWLIPSRIEAPEPEFGEWPPAVLAAAPGLAEFMRSEFPVRSAAMLVAHSESEALEALRRRIVDVAFIAMHGEYGEDGTVQGLLEAIGVPYTGSGVLASALGMDKSRSLILFANSGLAVPQFFVIREEDWRRHRAMGLVQAEDAFGFPLVTKPANRGSSVGVAIARTAAEAEAGVEDAFRYSPRCMVQRYIPGRELTCGVLETDRGLIALQPTEIIPQEKEFFDYYSKYTAGATAEITPPRLGPEDIERVQRTALAAHRILGCAGMSRTDMILGDDGELYVLELNTIPGMTETSLLPQAAAAVGISFPELLDCIIAGAFRDRA